MEDSYLINWRPAGERPEEASYILLRLRDGDGQVYCCPGAYENGRFLYVYGQDDGLLLEERQVLGWAYYPYDGRT